MVLVKSALWRQSDLCKLSLFCFIFPLAQVSCYLLIKSIIPKKMPVTTIIPCKLKLDKASITLSPTSLSPCLSIHLLVKSGICKYPSARETSMHLLTILGIAVALAMDAFAVAIATGVSLGRVSFRQSFRLSWHFGLFQALMPIIGWGLGTSIQSVIEAYAHWIAFAMLALVGSNMLKEAILADEDENEVKPKKDSTKGMTLVMLSVATSIDALAVGLSMSMLRVSIVTPAIIIGIVAGLFTIAGLHLGQRVARLTWLSMWAEVLGGLVLWLIGLNILRERGVFLALF